MRAFLILLMLMPVAAEAAAPDPVAKGILSGQCAACHTIPGIPGAYGDIGPSLKGVAARPTIAGKLPNNQANMVKWLMHPQQVLPAAKMPDQGLTSAQATKIAAYLATLDKP
jgi:cytochrome c2